MIIVQTPLRISFLGGGTDFEDFYLSHGGSVLSTAIDKFVFIIVKKRFDNMIYVNYSKKEIVDQVDMLEHDLVREAIAEKVKFESFTDNLSKKKREMVLTIYGEPNITATELAKKINSTKHSILNMLNELMDEKIVEESGKRGRARTFKIVDKYIRVLSEVIE